MQQANLEMPGFKKNNKWMNFSAAAVSVTSVTKGAALQFNKKTNKHVLMILLLTFVSLTHIFMNNHSI